MSKNVLIAGLLGGIVMIFWLFVSNAVLPFKSKLMHRQLPLANQLELHEALAGNITETGTYSVPYLSHEEEAQFPDYRNQPVYSVTFEGATHGAGSAPSVMPLIAVFVASFLAAWLLALAGEGVRSCYFRRVLFVAAIGLLVALTDDILQMSFGPQPKDYLVFLAINNVITWLLAGLMIGWRIKGPATTA